jgi:3-oxoadipate enol-lactonase
MSPATPLRYLEARPPVGTRVLGTVVLLHAFPLNARMWEPQLVLAAEGWRIIAPHMKAMDGASSETADVSFDAAAGSVVDLLDALHVEHAVIGGLSMGGYLTFALYKWAARYFDGMILADTRADADTPQMLEGRQRMLVLLRDKGPEAVADEMIPRLLGGTTRATQPAVADRVRSLALSNPPNAIGGALTAIMTREDSTPLLRKIDCPVLIIVGEEDALTPPALSQAMHGALPGSTYVTIPHAGHLSSLEQPVRFNEAVANFLRRIA